MDIGKAFRFVFEDHDWVTKVLIGGVMSLLSPLLIGVFFLAGYSVDLIKNVMNDVDPPLPRWDDLGDKAVKGIKLTVIFLVWAIPIIAVSILSALFSIIVSGNGGEVEGIVAAISLCFGCINFVLGILLALVSPAIYVRFAQTEQISSGFQFGEILAFTQRNLGDIVVALLISVVASIVAAIAGTILCLIGLLFTMFWASLVQSHLFGQIGRKDAGASALSAAPPTAPVIS